MLIHSMISFNQRYLTVPITGWATLTLKEGLKSWSRLRKREGVSSWRGGSFWRPLPRPASGPAPGVRGSSACSSPRGFIWSSTERNTLDWKRPTSSGVTALPLWRPSRGNSGDRESSAGGGGATCWEPPTKLSSFLSANQKRGGRGYSVKSYWLSQLPAHDISGFDFNYLEIFVFVLRSLYSLPVLLMHS